MKPVLMAGSTFTVTTFVGLVAGILIGNLTKNQFWAFIGLVAGMAVGAIQAVRLLMRSQ